MYESRGLTVIDSTEDRGTYLKKLFLLRNMAADVPEAATIAVKELSRGAGLLISDDVKREIARLVNEEKKPGRVVARELRVAPTSVYRIAGIARGDAKYLKKTEAPPKQPKKSELPLMPVPMPPCPFGGGQEANVILTGKLLSADEKYYLACLVNVQGMTIVAVAARYDLNPQSVQRYAKAVRTGKPFRTPGGPRTSIVDEQSDKVLRALAALVGEHRPSREAFLT